MPTRQLSDSHYKERNETLEEFEAQFERWFQQGDYRAGLCMVRYIVDSLCHEHQQKVLVYRELMLLLSTGLFVREDS